MSFSRRTFMALATTAAASAIFGGSVVAAPMASANTSKSIVLTGYGAFGARQFNSADIVGQKVADRLAEEGYNVTYINIPTEWATFQSNLEDAVESTGADAIISLGEEGQVYLPTVELTAYNLGYGTDATGKWFQNRIDPEGPTKREAPAANRAAQKAVKNAGYTITTSTDAGRYLCNAALYTNLTLLEQDKVDYAGFVHVPARVSANDPAADTDAEAVTEFVKELLNQ